jgi:hypothetical protein
VQNEANLSIADFGLRPPVAAEGDNIADWGQRCGPHKAKGAKRSQFGPGVREWARVAGRTRPGRSIVQNDANFGGANATVERMGFAFREDLRSSILCGDV